MAPGVSARGCAQAAERRAGFAGGENVKVALVALEDEPAAGPADDRRLRRRRASICERARSSSLAFAGPVGFRGARVSVT
jgi:hypothetical protein